MENLRIPPHSTEAEQSVLGAMLFMDKTDPKRSEVIDTLRPEMFYMRTSQLIFNAIRNVGNASDVVTVETELKRVNAIDEIGGYVYLFELCRNSPGGSNVISYAEIIKDRFYKRQLLESLFNATEQLFDSADNQEVISELSQSINAIDTTGAYEPVDMVSAKDEWLERMLAREAGDIDQLGVKTLIRDLDDQIGGIRKTWLVSLVGRPSMGKTIVAQLINANVSKQLPTLFFSMEMNEEEITDRYVSIIAGVSEKSIRIGTLNPHEFKRVGIAYQNYENQMKNVKFDCEPKLSVQKIARRAKSAIKKFGKLGLITIDYIGLMELPKADRHDLKIAEITRELKTLAKQIETPILLLAQANRELDKLARASNSNIADGSAIEKDSDLVLFVHNEEVNNHNTPLKGITEIYGTKGRHSKLTRSIYLRQSENNPDGEFKLTGGQFECVPHDEMALLLAEKNEELTPVRRGRTLQEKHKERAA